MQIIFRIEIPTLHIYLLHEFSILYLIGNLQFFVNILMLKIVKGIERENKIRKTKNLTI